MRRARRYARLMSGGARLLNPGMPIGGKGISGKILTFAASLFAGIKTAGKRKG